MTLIPDKKEFDWAYIFLISFIFNFISIVLSRNLIDAMFNINSVLLFALLSFVLSCFVCLGYFGLKLFSISFMITDIIAILNMVIMCIANKQDGWTDLTSFATYLFILLLGLLISMLIQLIKWTFIFKKEEQIIEDVKVELKEIKEELIEKIQPVKTKKPVKKTTGKKSNKTTKKKPSNKKSSTTKKKTK